MSPAPADVAYVDADAVLSALSSRREGLTDAEVESRRATYGRNQVAHEKPPAWPVQAARAFASPFNILLTTLAVVSQLTGDTGAAIIIAVMVLFGTVLRFVQEFRSTRAATALRAMVRTSAAVEREDDSAGAEGTPVMQRREVAIEELVPGDIVYLSAGDMVPADVRLLSARDVFVAQAALTGESVPVEKVASAERPAAPAGLTDLPTICFMGTSVVSGSATAVVIATGASTSFGRVAHELLGRRVETAFDAGVRHVSWLFIRYIAVMVPIVLVINGVTKGDWMEAMLFALAVAVGLTPEMLPMIVTTNLAKGAVTMARRKAIVKRLDAIQNFGAMDVLCTDKTGTLTQDRVVLIHHVNVVGEEDDFVLALAYLNSFYQTGLRNLLDVAVLEHGELHRELAVDEAYGKVDEIPFDFARRRMSVVVDHERRGHQLICKGAVDELMAACRYERGEEMSPDGAPSIVSLEAERRDDARGLVAELNEQGFRVVAVAYREFASTHGTYTVADESDLVLAGFVGFLDPPKESAAPALRALAEHRVAVKILTGDSDLVARKVCHDVGMNVERVVVGSELQEMGEAALREVVEKNTTFARLAPDDKVRIVRALRAGGHTVGFLGDGINERAGAARGGRRRLRGYRRGHRARIGGHHPAREEPDGTRRGGDGGQAHLRQHHQVPQDDRELELRERAERAGGECVAALPADAAGADPRQQPAVRRLADVHSLGRHGPRLPSGASAVAGGRHRPVHAGRRAGELGVRHPDLPAAVVRVRREHAGATVALPVWLVRGVTAHPDAHHPHDPHGEASFPGKSSDVAGEPAHRVSGGDRDADSLPALQRDARVRAAARELLHLAPCRHRGVRGADTGGEALVHSPIRDLALNDFPHMIAVHRSLLGFALLAGAASCTKSPEPRADTMAAMHAAHGATNDSAFAGVQSRGEGVMGVDQYTSQHVFETLPDGGRIILERPSASDTAGIRTIRAHMHEIAAAFAHGDFSAPGLVHAQQVPGTTVMAARAATLHYDAVDRPRGAEVRITTHDPEALAAVHEFLAFQRADHRAAGHEGMHATGSKP